MNSLWTSISWGTVVMLALVSFTSMDIKNFIYNKTLANNIYLAQNQCHLACSEFTSQDCKELGFIKSQLLCSSCDKLHEFSLEEIK